MGNVEEVMADGLFIGDVSVLAARFALSGCSTVSAGCCSGVRNVRVNSGHGKDPGRIRGLCDLTRPAGRPAAGLPGCIVLAFI